MIQRNHEEVSSRNHHQDYHTGSIFVNVFEGYLIPLFFVVVFLFFLCVGGLGGWGRKVTEPRENTYTTYIILCESSLKEEE